MTHSPRSLLLLAAGAALLAGCQKPKIHSYIAPRDATLDAIAPAPGSEPAPQISWMLPPGWQVAQGGQMSVASFSIEEAAGSASVTVTPLPNLSERESEIVNMWREQAQLGPLSPEETGKALTPIPVADGQGRIFEIDSTREGKPMRTIAAMLHRGAQSWFFKLSGDEAVAVANKEKFVDFLKTISFTSGPATAMAGGHHHDHDHSNVEEGHFHWTVPKAWQTVAPGQMQVAKFTVPAQGEAKADVAVSIFPNDTGGTLANVNRWRRQLDLPETDEAGLAACTQPLDAAPNAVLADLKNEQRAMLGAIVPRGKQFFFYKLMGDTAAVTAAREDFLSFVRSAP